MKNKTIRERYENSVLILEGRHNKDLTIGTEEYEAFLEAIIADLKKVKGSLRTRSRDGATHRKEADRIQSAISAMKYLSNKNRRILNNSLINESGEDRNDSLTRGDIRNFLKTYK